MRELVLVIAAVVVLATGCTSAPTGTAAVTDRVGDPDGELLRAAAAGDADAAARALGAGADIEARDDRQRTALLLAAAADHVEVARLLVSRGADPDALDAQHDTPWLVTGVTGSVEMLEALLPAHPDLTIVNRFGGVSVIPASERGHVDYVRRVVTTGIDVNHVNRLGWTALLEAVILGDGGEAHQEIVRILLAAGADPSIADKDGVTALEHARARGQDEIVALLEAELTRRRGDVGDPPPRPIRRIDPASAASACNDPAQMFNPVDGRTTPDRYWTATLPIPGAAARA